jgi:hypothetical protein
MRWLDPVKRRKQLDIISSSMALKWADPVWRARQVELQKAGRAKSSVK